VTLILVAVVLVAVLTMASGAISSLDMISMTWKQMEGQMAERNRTGIDCVNVSATDTHLEIVVSNDGHVSLCGFDSWDVIVEYDDAGDEHHARWLSYVPSSPGDNEWAVESICFQGDAETIEPGVLNCGEEMQIVAVPFPALGAGTTYMITVSTPSGVTSQMVARR